MAVDTDRDGRGAILSVRSLNVDFTLRGARHRVLRDVSLDVRRGENLAIVGESGSGKSVFCKSLMGLLDANGRVESGEILYEGADLATLTEKEWLKIRGKEIAIVMQDPMTSLNPLIPIGRQITEALRLHRGLKGKAAREAAMGYLRDVGIAQPELRFKQYPHEFSGGMRQRAVIAIAIACRPKILICDEPTTAIDVTIQAQILDLLLSLQQKYQLTTIYITHDLGVVARVADRVAVMYAGDFVEIGTTEEIFYDPRHPYVWALLSSMPQLAKKGENLYSIEGSPPDLSSPLAGDAFAPRNRYALKIDFVRRPPLFSLTETHQARSWLLDPRAPKHERPETKGGGAG
ncbi:MAG: ABC transporter ATP-binding protein [Clostridiales bacterium]|jgi:oligopeptide transport system ATP-binding protein|nr:ABC transporter ATP-binding protein [Clostridiales bacterium]